MLIEKCHRQVLGGRARGRRGWLLGDRLRAGRRGAGKVRNRRREGSPSPRSLWSTPERAVP